MFCGKTNEDKRKYAYEKAIEAYWKHVDRYHTWMNYYALFNGALFVGFCTLLCATNFILAGKGEYEINSRIIEGGVIWLKNDYEPLQIVICIIGLISAIAWLCSILGHEKWEMNWMNIITFYEDIGVYSILVSNLNKQPICKNKKIMRLKVWMMRRIKKIWKKCSVADDRTCHTLRNECTFKAYSTHKITYLFVLCIIIGWLFCSVYSILQYNSVDISLVVGNCANRDSINDIL